MSWFTQEGSGVRAEWGPAGATALAPHCAVFVIVDVLSFTTTVTVAAERGMRVHPYAWRDETAATFAREVGAVLAGGRREATPDHPWSLSPAALARSPVVPRLVLPSPNGSAIAAAAHAYGRPIVAASLRNATAVARWLVGNGYGQPDRAIGVIPAGERWPDGTLRPCLEDALGGGAVIAQLSAMDDPVVSAEARSLATSYTNTANVNDAVRDCVSGRELIGSGFAEDVEFAVDVDRSAVVPVLADGAFAAST